MRLIDADALIDKLQKEEDAIEADGYCCDNYKLIAELRRTPTASAWIPVEERLPEIGQAVLASKNNNCVFITEYIGNGNFRHAPRVYEVSKVDAWMPLPEAYVVDPKQQID